MFSRNFRSWWAQVDSNHRPHAYQACALTTWAMRPYSARLAVPTSSSLWWRWGGSNSWHPACKAGALPAELHPHIRDSDATLTTILKAGPSESNNISASAFQLKSDRVIWRSLASSMLHRKEVIQPHLPIRLPCYDFTPITNPTFGSALLAVRLLTSGVTGSHGVTGGVYKARERIHRSMLICDY